MHSLRIAIGRWAAGFAAGALVSFLLVTTVPSHAAPPAGSDSEQTRVRDRLYIWTHPAGSHNGYYLGPDTAVASRMTPVEGARYLDVPNIYFIHYGDQQPPLSECRKYAVSFRPMREVIWSLTGVGGRTSDKTRDRVLELAAEFPNISGFILDDFISWSERTVHQEVPQLGRGEHGLVPGDTDVDPPGAHGL